MRLRGRSLSQKGSLPELLLKVFPGRLAEGGMHVVARIREDDINPPGFLRSPTERCHHGIVIARIGGEASAHRSKLRGRRLNSGPAPASDPDECSVLQEGLRRGETDATGPASCESCFRAWPHRQEPRPAGPITNDSCRGPPKEACSRLEPPSTGRRSIAGFRKLPPNVNDSVRTVLELQLRELFRLLAIPRPRPHASVWLPQTSTENRLR